MLSTILRPANAPQVPRIRHGPHLHYLEASEYRPLLPTTRPNRDGSNSPFNANTCMSASRGIQDPNSRLPGSLAMPPYMLMARTTAFPFFAFATVTADITGPRPVEGIHTPSSPSGAATATSTGVTALRVSRACRTNRTGATFTPPSTPSVRNGMITNRSRSWYRTSLRSKSMFAGPTRNSFVQPSITHASISIRCPNTFNITNFHTPNTSNTNPPMPSPSATGAGPRTRSPRAIQSDRATEYRAPLSSFTWRHSPSTTTVAVGRPSSAATAGPAHHQ
ncbi:unnamed protein product [Phytophthora fragariaefolia]|uniref:Unnamed protein product n=1 Tax=Phytophthora fragariaefolia TaxID=1490495 RepID=A0A9W6UAK2_9STRA|nr:unnamed protein product [Phytophthora fragariaefolia]